MSICVSMDVWMYACAQSLEKWLIPELEQGKLHDVPGKANGRRQEVLKDTVSKKHCN